MPKAKSAQLNQGCCLMSLKVNKGDTMKAKGSMRRATAEQKRTVFFVILRKDQHLKKILRYSIKGLGTWIEELMRSLGMSSLFGCLVNTD